MQVIRGSVKDVGERFDGVQVTAGGSLADGLEIDHD
ncbi:hypothetical protein Enr13x_54400 [Stieleria neptunia]|uniref:Uncharacterized protein n=1 Tax=Stieleria neptunia TaxID=2527979 RepID=A0A518HXI4_9BACT|nr:hypothetical protein Enr13x_54400 [Stieleria neptunia]